MRRSSTHLVARSVFVVAAIVALSPALASARGASSPRPPKVVKAAPANAALESATQKWKALALDKKARERKSWWVKVVKGLESVAESESCPTSLVAASRAGAACEQAKTFGVELGDVRCEQDWVKAAKACPDDRQADDAWMSAAALAKSAGREADARKYAKAAAELGGDRKRDAAQLLADLGGIPAEKPAKIVVAEKPAPKRAETKPTPKPAEPVKPHDDEATEETLAETEGGNFDEMGDLLAAMDVLQDPSTRTAAAETLRAVKKQVLAKTGASFSELVGLKIKRIIIDAGHGGHDTGAIGPTGVTEKDVTLAIAKTLAEQLKSRGFEVVLTRDTDVFVSLEERTAIANRERGDLFVSVHANAHKSRRKGGVETYSLNVTSDRFARRLAARENATGERTVADLQYLLADLAVRANTVDSNRLAQLVQAEVVGDVKKAHGPIRDLGTKQALFFVLLGARMPAILVETAFLSNPAEEKKLASPAYQATVAGAIADGIDTFVARRTEVASAD